MSAPRSASSASAPRVVTAVAALACWIAPLPAQEPKVSCGYPQRDILSPFRNCTEVYAPPDAVYAQLRIMRALAERADAKLSFDQHGRQVVDDDAWRAALEKVESLGIDAGYLAEIMRQSKNGDDRDLAFYGTFFARDVEEVINLISHIPGEPDARIREKAFPRAIAYLQAHLAMKFGGLSDDQKKAMIATMPQPGSPVAKARGITRLPRDDDHLFGFQFRLAPFFQMLDLDSESDQAQALWFLKECFLIRKDLASMWLEPALPRVRQLLTNGARPVQEQAIGLLHTIAPKDMRSVAPSQDRETLLAWAKEVQRAMFPPIRVHSEGLVSLHPSDERDALVKAGQQLLATGGEAAKGRLADGTWYRGWRVPTLPPGADQLQLPAGVVVVAVNGAHFDDGPQLLKVLQQQLTGSGPRKLLVEYVDDGKPKAVEFRIL